MNSLYVCACVCGCACTRMPASVHACVRIFVCTCVRVCLCACVRVYVINHARTGLRVCAINFNIFPIAPNSPL